MYVACNKFVYLSNWELTPDLPALRSLTRERWPFPSSFFRRFKSSSPAGSCQSGSRPSPPRRIAAHSCTLPGGCLSQRDEALSRGRVRIPGLSSPFPLGPLNAEAQHTTRTPPNTQQELAPSPSPLPPPSPKTSHSKSWLAACKPSQLSRLLPPPARRRPARAPRLQLAEARHRLRTKVEPATKSRRDLR